MTISLVTARLRGVHVTAAEISLVQTYSDCRTSMQRALQNRKADTTVTARYVGCYIEPIPKLFEGYEIYGTLSETMTYQFNDLRGAGMGEGVTTGAV